MKSQQRSEKKLLLKGQLPPGHVIPGKRDLIGRLLVYLGGWATRLLVKLDYLGQENIPKDLPYVVAANHQTYVDGMWIFNGLPPEHYKNTCAMVGSDLKRGHGFMGRLITRCARPIPVGRHGGNPVRGLIMAKNAVDAGNNVLIHPEGTRSRNGRLGRVQSGAAYVACKCGVPLLPVFLHGAYDIWPRQAKLPRRYKRDSRERNHLIVEFGQPLLPENYEDPQAMTEALDAWLRERDARLDG